MEEREYDIGELAFYNELESIYKVRIIENNSNGEFVKYVLRIQDMKSVKKILSRATREIFSCQKRRNSKESPWSLEDIN